MASPGFGGKFFFAIVAVASGMFVKVFVADGTSSLNLISLRIYVGTSSSFNETSRNFQSKSQGLKSGCHSDRRFSVIVLFCYTLDF